MGVQHFQRGSGVFVCRVCGRRTRAVNVDHAQTGNCADCYELAGIDNTISDNGVAQAAAWGYLATARQHLANLRAAGANLAEWASLEATITAFEAERDA